MNKEILEAINEVVEAYDVEVTHAEVTVGDLEIEINFDLEKGSAHYCFESYGEAWNTDVEDDLVVIQVMEDKVLDPEIKDGSWEDDKNTVIEVSDIIKEKISDILEAYGLKFV